MNAHLRIFGATDCNKCKQLTGQLDSMGVVYLFIDANADETQDFCDEQKVDELPHVQIVTDAGVAFEAISDTIDPVDLVTRYIEKKRGVSE